MGILLLAIAGLSIYFIFQGKELIGIALLILCAVLEYRRMRIKKTAQGPHQGPV